MYALFVLDFDGTYYLEYADSIGVAPLVYLIKAQDTELAVSLAQRAHDAFHDEEEADLCIGDWFELFMAERKAFCKVVGNLEIPFGERDCDYLSDKIKITVV